MLETRFAVGTGAALGEQAFPGSADGRHLEAGHRGARFPVPHGQLDHARGIGEPGIGVSGVEFRIFMIEEGWSRFLYLDEIVSCNGDLFAGGQ